MINLIYPLGVSLETLVSLAFDLIHYQSNFTYFDTSNVF